VIGNGIGLAERKLDVCRGRVRTSTARLSVANNDLLNATFKSIGRRRNINSKTVKNRFCPAQNRADLSKVRERLETPVRLA